MTDINVVFCRHLLRQAHEAVKAAYPDINLRKAAYVMRTGRNQWEWHGPDCTYWYGRADNAYEARYKGWMAWLGDDHPSCKTEDDQ